MTDVMPRTSNGLRSPGGGEAGSGRRLRLLEELVGLKLHFLWTWLKQYPNEPFAKALQQRVGIARTLRCFQAKRNAPGRSAPGLQCDVESDFERIWVAFRDAGDADTFERVALDALQAHIHAQARAESSGDPNAWKSQYDCGCLRFEAPTRGAPRLVRLHFANTLSPRNPLREPGCFCQCLQSVVARAFQLHAAVGLQADSWLNSYAPWLACFPPEFARNRGPEAAAPVGTCALWGQFISADGSVNRARADYLRETGRFPFPRRTAHVSFAALAEFLGLGVGTGSHRSSLRAATAREPLTRLHRPVSDEGDG